MLDTLTISENIALALTINQVPANQIDSRVREIAEKTKYYGYSGEISLSSIQWSETTLCLCKSHYKSPKADPC